MAIIPRRTPASQEDAFIRSASTRKALPEDTHPPAPTIQSRYPVASFEVGGNRVAWPLATDQMAGGNRIVEHERPYREGAKLDNTGTKARRWVLQTLYNNTIDEPGVAEINGGAALYPDVLQRTIWLLTQRETGALIVPIDGKVRARPIEWQRVHVIEEVDAAVLTITFVEDNEDRIDAASFSRPSVSGSLTKLAAGLQLFAESDGVWSADLLSIQELCAELEGLMRSPEEYADAIDAQVGSIRRSLSRLKRATEDRTRSLSVKSVFLAPPLRVLREISRVGDVVGFANEQKKKKDKPKAWVEVLEETTIWKLAAKLGQPADELLKINGERIEDPFLILPGWYRSFVHWP